MLLEKHILWLLVGLTALQRVAADTTRHLRTTTTGQYSITYWTSEQGLPQNTVSCLTQTGNGYLWIGTRYGLGRYDGVRFADFTAELADRGDEDLDVQDLAQDTAGHLWLLTRNHLIDYHQSRFHSYSISNAPILRPSPPLPPST
jgi:ligand-binding sensor domain-containing protein